MKILNLYLIQFRNHTKLTLDFTENVTLITGPNGVGKTNILEAIYILSTGKSHRSKYDKDLIQHGKDFCTIGGKIQTDGDILDMELQIIANKKFENAALKKVKINKVSKSMQYFSGVFNSVLFSPEDIQLITGSPSERRKYMDNLLSQVDIDYKRKISDYSKAVRQRNRLLEKIFKNEGGQKEIEFWTQKILVDGKFIQEKRDNLLDCLKPFVRKVSKKLNKENTETEIKYIKNLISPERLEEYKEREIGARTTLVGPHRDDFEIIFNKHNVSEFGSRGEQRSCVLALKLSEIEYIEKIKKEKPVLLLDDIFSELDEEHQKAVVDVINEQQTTITTTANLGFLESQNIKTISLPI